jgi:hypothetical protein
VADRDLDRVDLLSGRVLVPLASRLLALPAASRDQHRPRPVLLAVDQELGEGATLGVAPELADPVGPLEVGKHEDVEKLGAGSGTEGVQALP